jgi:Amt family ammonium transporter
VIGYSLAFSDTARSTYIGDGTYAFLRDVFSQLGGGVYTNNISLIVYVFYQLQFAAVTVAIIFGSVSGRVRILPSIIFMACWTTIVYDPIACWTWGPYGWLKNLSCIGKNCGIGALDFAGGGPVHMSSGAAALAFAIVAGKRISLSPTQPSSVINVFIGTGLLFAGWIGFNGGSALTPSARAGMATWVGTAHCPKEFLDTDAYADAIHDSLDADTTETEKPKVKRK